MKSIVCWWHDNKKCLNAGALCMQCKRNSARAICRDYCMEYVPTCRFGFTDCISDPAYIHYHYHEWYKELYGDKLVDEISCEFCEEGSHYDDEDK